MPRTATVKRLTFPEGRRVLAISDIHGNLPFLKGVLAAAHYGPDDILVLVGDLVEKGPDSLTTLRFIMELAERNTVYGLRGNCDNLVSEFVAARGEEERFYRHYVDVWRDRCLLVQMGHAAGFETRGPEELPALREVVRARFGPELAFLEAMPEILLTPDYLFVHGGVADEAHLEGLDEIAVLFEQISQIEKDHEFRFMSALAGLKRNHPAKESEHMSQEQVVTVDGYRCVFCGAVFDHRPDVCGVCEAIGAFEPTTYRKKVSR